MVTPSQGGFRDVQPRCDHAVKAVKFCRVVVYPAVRGWCGERVQLEVADEIAVLGYTDYLRGAGQWLVIYSPTEQVVVEVERLRGASVQVLRNGGKAGALKMLFISGLVNPV